MATQVEICNMALAYIGHTVFIEDLDTEASQEAILCRLFFEQMRDAVLEDHHWPFASKDFTLNLIEEDPNTDWAYSYAYPTDCIRAERIVTGLGEPDSEKAPYRIHGTGAARRIYTNEEDAVLKYTARITDVSLFSASFVEALAWRIAAAIALGLGRKEANRQVAMANYNMAKAQAQVNAANEMIVGAARDSEFITVRE